MAYTPVTSINDPALTYAQWSTPEYPIPTLAASISADDTEISFSAPLLDPITGDEVTGRFLFNMIKANGYIETAYVPAAGMSADGLTATGVVRGVRRGGLDVTTGDPDLAVAHLAGEPVTCNISATIQAITIAALTAVIGANIKLNGRMLFMGSGISAARIFANATARDAAIPSPQNGDECYLTDLGQCQDYVGGSWQARASGTNPNGSETVAGKFEEATQTQNDAGTTVGETGADLVATPTKNARSIQKGAWTYALDTGSVNSLVFTLAVAPTSLVAGFSFKGKIANTNTGAVVANVNALGSVDVYAKNGADLLPNDLIAGGIYDFEFDGTGFQVSTPFQGYGFGAADALYTTGVLGETFSASDITNNLNLAYFKPSDGKWWKVTSDTSTWYGQLGLVCQSGIADDEKKVLLKGQYSNQTFSNINPTFSSALTGTNNNVGDTTGNSLRAFLVNNTTGAEAVITGGTISARQQGTPTGAMQVYLVLEQQDQTDTPACFRDATNNVAAGAIIGSATIAQALFSGTYQNLTFSFGSVKIPAGAKVYLVVGAAAAADAANYYQVQSNAATLTLNSATMTWSGTVNAGNITLTVTSTSPVGYNVKLYTGSNGSYGLTLGAKWTRNIGTVYSSTELFFDPVLGKTRTLQKLMTLFLNPSTLPIATCDFGFSPNSLRIGTSVLNDAATDTYFYGRAYLDGTVAVTASNNQFAAIGASANSNNWRDGGGFITNSALIAAKLQGGVAGAMSQNFFYAVRLENGCYFYVGYPAGTGYISAGAGTHAATIADIEIVANT